MKKKEINKEPEIDLLVITPNFDVVDTINTNQTYVIKEIKEVKYKTLNEIQHFIRTDESITLLLAKEIFTGAEMQVYFAIASHVGYGDKLGNKVVMKNGINTGKALNGIDIRKCCNDMDYLTFKRASEELEKKQIIKIVKSGRNNNYYANPFVFRNSDYIPLEVYGMFRKSKWNIYNQ